MKETEDLIYIERIKRGDPASYTFLVDKYRDMAYTIARRVTQNTGDAEDAAQEGFVRAYQQLHRFEGKSKFSTWLYTIIYRAAVDKSHKNRLRLFAMDDKTENISEEAPGSLETEEQAAMVRKAIERLPVTESLLVTLFYLDDRPVKEIAEITGMTEVNIKVKLFRSRKILQEQLRFLL